MWQQHNAQLTNFDVTSLRVIWLRRGSLFGFRTFFAFGRAGVESRLSGLTRDTVIWYMDNNVHVTGTSGPTLPAGWNLVGAADFNGNGKPDYLLNASMRHTLIWYMNKKVHVTGASSPTLPSGWNLVAP